MEDAVTDLASAGELLTTLADRLATTAIDRLNARTVRFAASARDVPIDVVSNLASRGLKLESRFELEYATVRAEADAGSGIALEVDGAINSSVDASVVDAVLSAVETNNLELLARLIPDAQWRGSLTLANDPAQSGFSWVASEKTLESLADDNSWIGFLSGLFGDESNAVLVVGDGDRRWLRTRGLLVAGPEALDVPRPASDGAAARAFRNEYWTDERVVLPPPTSLIHPRGEGLDELHPLMRRLAHKLCWYWIASRVARNNDRPAVIYDGARVVQVELAAGEAGMSGGLDFWRWATASREMTRWDAVQHAASLALFGPDDFSTAGAAALRTAKSVYEVGRKGVFSELLASRRSAREAALSTAHKAADSAQTVASKALERVVVQAGAAAGILIANNRDLLNDLVVLRLLELIAAAMILTALLAVVDFRSAFASIAAFKKDIALYRDALSDEDVKDIVGSQGLHQALRHTKHSAMVCGLLFGVSFLILAALLRHFSGGRLDGLF